MVRDVRRRFKYSDRETNPGMVVAARVEGTSLAVTELKMVVHHRGETQPVQFTAAVDSEVEMIVNQVLVELDRTGESCAAYLLQVHGLAEYMSGGRLSQYEYVHNCLKYDRDVRVTLVHRDRMAGGMSRTKIDDDDAGNIGLQDILPTGIGLCNMCDVC